MRLPMDADAGYVAGPAASDAMQRTPGTLRVSDLVGFDALGGSGNEQNTSSGVLGEGVNDADPRAQ